MSASYSAGDARLQIVPDATGFKKKLEADMSKVRADFGLNVTAQTAQARADIERLRDAEQRNGLNLNVDANLAKLQAELAVFRAKQHLEPVKMPVTVDKASHAKVETDAKELAGKFADAFKSALAVNLLSAGFGLIPGLVTGAAELTQALQQLSQAALLVPGAMSAAGSSIGTLMLGLSGVTDAWSALGKEADQAGANQKRVAEQSATAAQNLSRAQRELGNAYRDTRRELEDLNISLRGGQLSEQQAILNAQKVRRDLANDLARGQVKDQLDYQSRMLDIAQADQSVVEAHQRNIELQEKASDANQKGIENADRVVSAHQAVAAAQARTKEAADQASTASDAAAQAMAKLAPNAQEFVRVMQDLKPQFLELRSVVQTNMFAGLGESMRTLVAADIPVLKTGLGSIGTAWNSTLKQIMASMGSDSTKGLLGQLFGNTAEAQTRMNAAIDPLVHAFGVLSVAGSKTLPRLADVFDRLATRFDHFIDAAAKDGRLDKWIRDGERGFANIGNILLNVGKAFDSIHTALGGGGILAGLDHLTKKMADFFASGKGQNELHQFFAEGRNELEKWKPILQDLPGIFKGMFSAATDSTYTFLPVLREVSHLLSTNPELVRKLVDAFLLWKTIRPVIDGVQAGMGLLSTAILNVSTGFAPLKDKAKAAMDGVSEEFEKAGNSNSKMAKFAGGLSALSGAGGAGLALLVSVGIPLVQTFVTKFTQDMDDAANSAAKLDEQAKNLIGSLDRITNLTGTAFRTTIAQQYASGQTDGSADKGLGGNVLAAAAALGIGGQGGYDLVTATLPGGEQQYGDIMGQLREKVRPQVQRFIHDQGIDMGKARAAGIDENTILDAWLGVPDAVKKIQGWTDLGKNVVDLGVLYNTVSGMGPNDAVYQASLIGQRLNFNRSASGGAVTQAQQTQAAAVGQWALKPEFANTFANAQVNGDGTNVTIVSTTPPAGLTLDAGTTAEQLPPPNQDKWTYRLSSADAGKFTQRTSSGIAGKTAGGYASGGRVNGPGSPTSDSIPAWLSDGEYVVNAAATAKHLPLLEQINGFADGGLVDPTGNPATPGMLPGPSVLSPAGNAPIAPAGPSAGGGLLGAFLGGLSGTVGNVVSMGAGLAGATLPGAPAAGSLTQQAGVTPMTQAGTREGMFASRAAQIPGLWGLVGGLMSPDPVGSSMQWAGNTLDWAASSGMNILGKATSTLWSGALGMFGLQNSILSPSNVYNQAGKSVLDFATGGSGPAGTLLGMNSGAPGGGGVSGGVPGAGQLGSQAITLGDGSTISIPTYGTASGLVNPTSGGSVQNFLSAAGGALPGTAPAGSGEQLIPGQWGMMDALGQKFGLTMTSGFRSANGPTIAGVPAGQSYHASGRAHDYSNGRQTPQELAFAQYVAAKYGAQIKELIFDYPGFNATIKDGRVVGPFGAFYTLGQAGDHSDHVHVAFNDGGGVSGPGGPVGDKIPAYLSDGEHVLTAADVAAMGGQGNVYAFRSALHRADGGPILQAMVQPIKPLPTPPPAPASTAQGPAAPNAVTPIGTPPPPPGAPSTPSAGQPGQPTQSGPDKGGQAGPTPADGQQPAAPQAPLPDQNGQKDGPPTSTPEDDLKRASEKLTSPGGAGMGAAPTNLDHTLPALNSAVMSGAQNIGSWITTAVSAAAAGSSMGAGGGAAAGALSPLIQGGIMQGAKVLTGGLNVLSSFLVGNVPGSYGGADDGTGYGQIVRAQQRDPVTSAAPRVQNNTFNGMDVPRVFQELDLRDAQHKQAALAGYRG